tara:strand:+ start:339 stop:1019 length:681 start_codon:yes stop_codon:yes gene_type:complete
MKQTVHAKIAYHKAQMKIHREGMNAVPHIKYSSRRLGGHTTQYRRLCRLAGVPIEYLKTACKPISEQIIVIGKPCRYKACKGVNHKALGEKCPIASARGKTGGKAGEGDSKRRTGETNGRYIDGRAPIRATKSQTQKIMEAGQNLKPLGPQVVVKKVLNIDWINQAVATALVAPMLRGVQGICTGCNATMPALKAVKVHRSDVASNPARIICDACDTNQSKAVISS